VASAKEAGKSVQMTPLGRLIRDRMAERGWSFRNVADRGKLSPSTVQQWTQPKRLKHTPRPDLLEKLARGLMLPEQQVRDAAAQSAGFTIYREISGEYEKVLATLESMTEQQRRMAFELIETIWRQGHNDDT
jgi:transcriptional regulator with XRE-family HTH domain